MDELLQELRSLSVGCYVAGLYCGAVGFCDDILLLAPTRDGMQVMLNTCESFALRNNLQFSTDPNPAKSNYREKEEPAKAGSSDSFWKRAALGSNCYTSWP